MTDRAALIGAVLLLFGRPEFSFPQTASQTTTIRFRSNKSAMKPSGVITIDEHKRKREP